MPASGRNGVIELANQKARQDSGIQPIVRHPLFPTIVAFWFAALFGLGSLAVRTSLLESLVIASKIDLLVPQTAPPLGITSRILIALGLAALGSILGFVLALRLARPKPEMKQERVRNFGASVHGSSASARDLPADQDMEGDRYSEPDRRRALIASNEALDESVFDDGPSFLTGLSPNILDVTEFECDPIDRQPAEQAPAEQQAQALELDQFDTIASTPGFESLAVPPEQTEPLAGAFARPQPTTAPSVEVPAEPASPVARPFAPPAELAARSFAHSVEMPAAMASADPVLPVQTVQEEEPVAQFAPEAQHGPTPHSFAAPVTSPLQFSVNSLAIAAASPPVQAKDAPEPAEPSSIKETSFSAAGADGAGDADPLAAFRNKVAPMPVFHDEPDDGIALEVEETGMFAVAAACSEVEAEPEPAAEPLSVFSHAAPPLSAASERLMNANLSDLSPVELIERLALSLQRRGHATTLSSLPVLETAPEPSAEALPAGLALDELPAAEVPPAEVPAADTAEREPDPRLILPAAMRPIDFSQYEHEDALPDYVPGRSITLPSVEAREPEEAGPESVAAGGFAAPQESRPMPRFGRPVEGGEEPAQSEDEVLEAGYSSLLDMSRPAVQRPQFVRVIDPEAETEAAEPIVIFPGQAMRAGTRFAQPSEGPVVAPNAPPPSLAEAPAQSRRFDAPPVQGQSGPARSPEETERALRSALSTLQRMSGAA